MLPTAESSEWICDSAVLMTSSAVREIFAAESEDDDGLFVHSIKIEAAIAFRFFHGFLPLNCERRGSSLVEIDQFAQLDNEHDPVANGDDSL